MLVLVMFSQMGMGTSEDFGNATIGTTGEASGYLYDENGHAVLNATDLSPTNSSEEIRIMRDQYTGLAYFTNTTGLFPTPHFLYFDSGGSEIVLHKDLGRSTPEGESVLGIDISDAFAFMTIISVVIVFVGIIGFTFFGTGISDVSISVIILFSIAVAFWTILSVGAIDLITAIPTFGPLGYVVLTLMYAVGCLQNISGVSSE